MPKVAQETLDAFGKAVKRERSLRGWSLDELSSKMGGTSSRSFLSNVEGGKRQISPPTVGKLIKALDLDQDWIDRFLEDDIAPEAEETPVDRETDRLLRLKAKDDKTPDAPEDLLILLANTHAQGQYTDTFTAYSALKAALQAAERLRQSGEMPANTGGQLQAVMAEVAHLNAQGRMDEADDLLEAEEKRMRAAHRAEKERQDAQAKALLDKRIDQDRLRNDPQAAAERLIADLRQQPDRGKLFWGIFHLSNEWRETGDRSGDIFAIRVAIALARINWERSKNKRDLSGFALHSLGAGYARLAERSTRAGDLENAYKTFNAALEKSFKTREPLTWAERQCGLAGVLLEMGERAADAGLLRRAVSAHRAAMDVRQKENAEAKHYWNNLGNALQKLGEITQDPAPVAEAVKALTTALALKDKTADPLDWETTQNNLAVALRWQGALIGDRGLLQQARDGYAKCEAMDIREKALFRWARLQWNIADLALARFDLDPDPALLDEAETHVTQAREVFAEGSDHQTQRCDDLLQKILAARANLP